jgi:general secretion pathway protein C
MELMMNSKPNPAASPNGSPSGVQRLIASRWLAVRNVILIVNLALVALLGYFIWGIVTRRHEIRTRAVVEAPNPGKASASKRVEPTPPEHAAGGSRSLFGTPPVSMLTSESGDEPATQLQLKLLGTIPGEKSIALADIQDIQSKAENLYHIGDTVQGAQVVEIARGRVILLVNGKREVLEMTVSSGGEMATAEAPKPATTGPVPSIHEVVKVLSPTDFQINRQNFLTRVGRMEAVLKTVKLEPYVVDGKTQGMRISGLSDDVAAMASLANLQNGDVIQNINGQELTSPQKTFQVLQKARSQPELDVQVLRGDSVIPLHFSMTGSE